MAKMTGSTNHLIKEVALAEEKINRSGQEEPSLLQAEMAVSYTHLHWGHFKLVNMVKGEDPQKTDSGWLQQLSEQHGMQLYHDTTKHLSSKLHIACI